MTTTRTRGQRFEGVVQVLILLTIATVAAAASFTHVHNVAAAHGQPGWLAWADAIVLELMSIATGLEIRRRHRTGQSTGFVLTVMASGVALSLSAQVVEAERSVIGWIAAALPAAGFLALVKIVLGRTSTGTTLAEDRPTVLSPADDRPAPPATPEDEDTAALPGLAHLTPALPLGLLDRARAVASAHTSSTGRPVTRDVLRDELRVSNALAGDVLRALRSDTAGTVNGHRL
jgi:hypothetical protein